MRGQHDRPLLDRGERETVAGEHEPVEPRLPEPEQLVGELGRAVVQIARLLAAPAREAVRRAAALAVAVLDEARTGAPVDEALVVVDAPPRSRRAAPTGARRRAAAGGARRAGRSSRARDDPRSASWNGGSTSTVSAGVRKRRSTRRVDGLAVVAVEPLAQREHRAPRDPLHGDAHARDGAPSTSGTTSPGAGQDVVGRRAGPRGDIVRRAASRQHERRLHVRGRAACDVGVQPVADDEVASVARARPGPPRTSPDSACLPIAPAFRSRARAPRRARRTRAPGRREPERSRPRSRRRARRRARARRASRW